MNLSARVVSCVKSYWKSALGKQLPGIFVAFKETPITSQVSWDSGGVQEKHGTGSPSSPGHTGVCQGVLLPSTNLPEGKGTDGQFPSEGRDALCFSAHLPSTTI